MSNLEVINTKLYNKISDFVEDVRRIVCGNDVVLLSHSNNYVYSIDNSIVLKIFIDKSSNNFIEFLIMELLQKENKSLHIIKKFIKYGEIKINGEFYKYDITKYIEGKPLDKVILNNNQIYDIINIVNDITSIPMYGFGSIKSGICGKHNNWSNFIREYMMGQINKSRYTANMFGDQVIRLLDEFVEGIKLHKGVLLPMDLNKKNLILTERKIKINNLPVMWAGDKLAAYGEFLSHFYDDTCYYFNLNRFFNVNNNELRQIYVYCFFMLFTTLVFVEKNKTDFCIYKEKPWGSQSTFYSLLNNIYERIYL